MGVYTAYFQMQKWAGYKVTGDDEHQMLFVVSLVSWFVYPIHWIVWLYRKCMED